jgi:hypothetical protein
VTVAGVAAAVDGESWLAVGVPVGEGMTILTALATDAAGGLTGAASVSLARDATPPRIAIELPIDGARVGAAAVSVAGLVNDLVAGSATGTDATVTVAGVPAQVRNRSFLAEGVPLAPGENLLEAVAVDAGGNVGRATVRVVRGAPEGPHLAAVGGDGQSAVIGAPLPEPLVVEARDAGGAPVAGVEVTFRVLGNDGHLGAGARRLSVVTDGAGRAAASFTLGGRAGLGNQRVEATAEGYAGVVLAAGAETGAPVLIVVETGDQQTDVAGQRLSFPLVAAVLDAGFNRLAGVPVRFEVVRGGGRFADGETTFVTVTDPSGRASAALTLGEDDGVANNVVEARIEGGDDGVFAAFVATGRAAGRVADTAIEGVVLDNADQPVPGAMVWLPGTPLFTHTDAGGYFRLAPAPPGLVLLHVNGDTTPRAGTWPRLEFLIMDVPGRVNGVRRPLYLLPIDVERGRRVSATTGGTLTLPEVPGFALEIAPGSVTFPDGSREGVVSVTSVHPDKVPMSPAFAQQPRFIVTVQPAGAVFEPPARLAMPNVDGLPPGAVTELYSFDHDLGSFVGIGPATVSEDGLRVTSNPGVGIVKAGWHCGGNPTASGTPHDCTSCEICDGSQCVPGCAAQSVGEPALDLFANLKACSCVQDDPCKIKSCSEDGGPCDQAVERKILSVEATANNEDPFEGEFVKDKDVLLIARVKAENCPNLEVKLDTGEGVVLTAELCDLEPDDTRVYCKEWEYSRPGHFRGKAEAICHPCTKERKDDNFDVKLFKVEITLAIDGDITISTDGKYTEDAKIKASAIRTDTGDVYTDFNETLPVVEEDTMVYSKNTEHGAMLPSSAQFTAGEARFTAKSLAPPNGDQPPAPARITIRGDYEVRGGPLSVEQWVTSGQIDPRWRDGTYDWVEARARDLLGEGDPVFDSIIAYEQAVLPDDNRDAENLATPGQPTSIIRIDPHENSMRIDGVALQVCSFLYRKNFTSTMLHEGRHGYQWWLLYQPLGTDDNQDGFYSNSDDQDGLVDVVPLAPSDYLLDTADDRTVCDIDITKTRQTLSYQGDLVFDRPKEPHFVSWAHEMDAFDYSDDP